MKPGTAGIKDVSKQTLCCAESSSPPIFDVESETHYNKHRRRMSSDTPRNKHYYNNTHAFESMQL